MEIVEYHIVVALLGNPWTAQQLHIVRVCLLDRETLCVHHAMLCAGDVNAAISFFGKDHYVTISMSEIGLTFWPPYTSEVHTYCELPCNDDLRLHHCLTIIQSFLNTFQF